MAVEPYPSWRTRDLAVVNSDRTGLDDVELSTLEWGTGTSAAGCTAPATAEYEQIHYSQHPAQQLEPQHHESPGSGEVHGVMATSIREVEYVAGPLIQSKLDPAACAAGRTDSLRALRVAVTLAPRTQPAELRGDDVEDLLTSASVDGPAEC